jgi:copper chaperone
MMNEYTFKTNINCGSCIKSVTPFLNELDNLEMWKVDTENPDKILTVQLEDTNVETVLDAIKKAGYSIELRNAAN